MNFSDTSLRIKAVTSATLDQPLSLDPVRLGVDDTLRLPDTAVGFSTSLLFEGADVTASVQLNTGTVTVEDEPAAAIPATATIELTDYPLTDGTTITIDGVTYEINTTPAAGNIPGNGTSLDAQADDIVAAINGTDGYNTPHPTVTAINDSLGIILLTAITAGTVGNALTLAKGGAGPGDLILSGATFSGGTARVLGVIATAGDGLNLDRQPIAAQPITTLVIIVTGGEVLFQDTNTGNLMTMLDGTRLVVGCPLGVPLMFSTDAVPFTLRSTSDGPTTVEILAYGNAIS